LLVLFTGVTALSAQSKQLLSWQEELTYLLKIPAAELSNQRDALVQIRAGVGLWLKLHSHTTIELPDAPPQPWTAEQMRGQISVLREKVAAIMKEDPARPFELGITTISVTAETSPIAFRFR
jgi:hypothetical protein